MTSSSAATEGLGKKYLMATRPSASGMLPYGEVMARGARNLWRKTADIGKTTLLKILSRITEPSEDYAHSAFARMAHCYG
jgi:hypothetical protein